MQTATRPNYFQISCGRKQKRNENCFKSRKCRQQRVQFIFILVETKIRRKKICLKSSQQITRPNTANDRHTENSVRLKEASADKSSTIISCKSYISLLNCECKSNVGVDSILVEIVIIWKWQWP